MKGGSEGVFLARILVNKYILGVLVEKSLQSRAKIIETSSLLVPSLLQHVVLAPLLPRAMLLKRF